MEYSAKLVEPSEWARTELVHRIGSLPNREWASGYFDLMKELLEVAALRQDDPRLLLSMPKTKSSNPYHLPMSINNRYVLDNKRQMGKYSVRFIYGPHFDWRPDLQAMATAAWRYRAQRGQTGLMPLYLQPRGVQTTPSIPAIFREGWLEAAYIEANRRVVINPKRQYHQPIVYCAAMDLDYRAQLLDGAFQHKEERSEK